MSKVNGTIKEATKKAATVKFNYGRFVEFALEDVRSACKEVGVMYRANMAAAKKQSVYNWLVDHEVQPAMAMHEDGAKCYGSAAASVMYNKMAPLNEEELAVIKERVRNAKDTSDEDVTPTKDLSKAARQVMCACDVLVNESAYTPQAAAGLSYEEVKGVVKEGTYTEEEWNRYAKVMAIYTQWMPEIDNVTTGEDLRLAVADAINGGMLFEEVDNMVSKYYIAHPYKIVGKCTSWLSASETPAKEEVAPAKDSVREQVIKDVANLDVVLNEVVRYASVNRYNNIPDYRLYSNLRLSAIECRDALNTLYKQGMITVKVMGNYKLIAPTTKAVSATASNRPVSKEVCLKVFKAIAKYEYENTQYLNVSHKTLERTVAVSVGVVTFDNALNKLINAGYIEAKVVGAMTVYTSTQLGRDRLQSMK